MRGGRCLRDLMWGGRPLRAPVALPGPLLSFWALNVLWPLVPLRLWLWLPAYVLWLVAFWPAAACLSRPFATLNCLCFAVRVRVRRGGRLVVRQWDGWVPSFACDLGDRLAFTYQPRRATPRVLWKATGEERAAAWEDF